MVFSFFLRVLSALYFPVCFVSLDGFFRYVRLRSLSVCVSDPCSRELFMSVIRSAASGGQTCCFLAVPDRVVYALNLLRSGGFYVRIGGVENPRDVVVIGEACDESRHVLVCWGSVR